MVLGGGGETLNLILGMGGETLGHGTGGLDGGGNHGKSLEDHKALVSSPMMRTPA